MLDFGCFCLCAIGSLRRRELFVDHLLSNFSSCATETVLDFGCFCSCDIGSLRLCELFLDCLLSYFSSCATETCTTMC